MTIVIAILELLALAAIVAGVALVSLPAALIVGGVGLLAIIWWQAAQPREAKR